MFSLKLFWMTIGQGSCILCRTVKELFPLQCRDPLFFSTLMAQTFLVQKYYNFWRNSFLHIFYLSILQTLFQLFFLSMIFCVVASWYLRSIITVVILPFRQLSLEPLILAININLTLVEESFTEWVSGFCLHFMPFFLY